MYGTPSLVAPSPECKPQSAWLAAFEVQSAFTVGESLTPVKQYADAGPVPQEFCIALVFSGLHENT
jgi:hypothetical protein